ncbi:ABC transporter ATP-binding protein [Denitrobaculum tricleocarpae]|uniref:ATP-binding cassette domain-containing protein n=1 Tax=Denitrobaculum tricleocarpae TaxID=2591009 RepID=A0A545U1U5_9PROT|nr:oligopeptide/dipeptide ABC transporter ATP-binding protein [Denitrobaculum tricleocarpae]TQV83373.1 ATP-binding cassette domain-containing protein [Denitrobaculum tricleocarpae]
MSETLLEVQDIRTEFSVSGGGLFQPKRRLRAVNDVSFTLRRGETLGIVGESGCGKSTLGRSLLRLIEPSAGRVLWQGEDIAGLSPEKMRLKRRDMQMIFQDPIASLDPRMTIGDIIAEPLTVFERSLSKAERRARVLDVMDTVGLSGDMLNRYPHEFSGGQAQRIGIARAIITRPKLVVCDEPVSALDVSIQAQIINLLQELKRKFGLTMIFISHDLSIMRLISDRIMVLYLGRVVELSEKSMLFADPKHPYTRALLSAAPVPDPKTARARQRIMLRGDPPSPLDPPSGCAFRTRCPLAQERCAQRVQELETVAEGQEIACEVVAGSL